MKKSLSQVNTNRPFSNPKHLLNSNQKVVDSQLIYLNHNEGTDCLKSKGFSNRNNRKHYINSPLTECEFINKQNKEWRYGKVHFNKDIHKLYPLNKMKIEKAFLSSKLIEQFSKMLTLNYSQSTRNFQTINNQIGFID